MSLIRWNPQALFPNTSNWLDDFFSHDDGFWVKNPGLPAVNVSESKDSYKLEFAAPGYKKSDFKVEVKDGYLHVSAETKEEKEEKEEKYTRKEWKYASFSRAFSLPDGVKNEAVAAQYDDGVLKITVPKLAEEKKEKTAQSVPVN